MKTREDFVSNSSSSSFIVISDKGDEISSFSLKKIYGGEELVAPNDFGCHGFGWQCERYYDFWSKLNWCAIIALEQCSYDMKQDSDDKLNTEISKPWFKGNKMKKLLKKICKDKLGVKLKFMPYDELTKSYSYYIDHQSDVYECPENARMFADEKKLTDFLFNDHSFIDNSNDNGGRDDEEFDEVTWRPLSIPKDYEV